MRALDILPIARQQPNGDRRLSLRRGGLRIQTLPASVGGTTLTTYIGDSEEAQSVNGDVVTLTTYLSAPGMPQAIHVGTGGSLRYLMSGGHSSMSEALCSSGTVTAQQLYAPSCGARYSNGTLPTSKGFTGAATG